MRLNPRTRELSLKIVYYGPGLSGKTTNLKVLHASAPETRRGKLVQLDTETERTLFFDYFPLEIGSVRSYRVKLDFFTVPGQSFYHQTRRAVLDGADGVVFVADSHPSREDANMLSWQDLCDAMQRRGRAMDDVPHVFQWNKRDVPGAMGIDLLTELLNPHGAPAFEAVASRGQGVLETQDAVARLVLASIRTDRARVHA